ncbi:MAG: 3-deoxy-D-manno-octulosonic acid transferase [Opitutales bacterium]
MIWLYRLLYLPVFFVASPYYLFRMWRRGGYLKDFPHRLGLLPRLPPPPPGKKRIWLQAVSVGEVFAVGPLIEALQAGGEAEIVLTTTTSTGYAEARKRYENLVHSIGIFPLDFWLFSRTAWSRIQPDAAILTESELWPEHLHQAQKRGIPTFLVNARISDVSYRRYRKVSGAAECLLQKLEHAFAASDQDRARLVELGLDKDRILSTGSIKFDVHVGSPLSNNEKEALRKSLGFEPDESGKPPFILLGSSTWPGEETALLRTQDRLLKSGIDCRLLLVPRHAERGPELVRLLESQTRPWRQRSRNMQPSGPVSIHLADTTGELARLSQTADLAFIGKSLPPNEGGQTPIEAAGLGIPVLMGPNMSNFKAVAESLVHNGAAKTVKDGDELENLTLTLAMAPETRAEMSEAGRNWHEKNRGSSQRIAEVILENLKQ